MEGILKELEDIVGRRYVSASPEEKYIYSRDQGLQEPHDPDAVVLPGSTEEVQAVIRLANRERVPVVPMGGGLVLSGLTIPQKGGIVLDMKRMNRIIEVNETSRYAVVEGGVSQGVLKAYLERRHPGLKHSLPDAPPVATIAGNVAIHGSGHLSQSEGGFHSEMVTGLEAVLPTGEAVRLGSCSTVPGWFSRAPLPDLAGLFLGWNGTTGIITKIGIKLFPKPKMEDILVYMTGSVDILPDLIYRITGTEMAEDMVAAISPKPDWLRGFPILLITVTANSEEEMAMKVGIIRESVRHYYQTMESGFMPVPPYMKSQFLGAPLKDLSKFADVMKGGGFEYVGSIMPVEKLPGACSAGLDIAEKHRVTCSMGARVIGRGHCMMFFNAYAFNRADEDNMARSALALEETNRATLELGGIPWKAEAPGQQDILRKMEPGTIQLMNRIRSLLDPNGIMNPGNWEAR
ncbi:MAG: FAD-binding oxidoreductase [Spirochaetes bacterium]|nr:FAD-binding oxidoreductase [Spirochaetota bacterium]